MPYPSTKATLSEPLLFFCRCSFAMLDSWLVVGCLSCVNTLLMARYSVLTDVTQVYAKAVGQQNPQSPNLPRVFPLVQWGDFP
ncbi:hypothetical protein JOD20_000846 [Herpetosiphon giganteus]|nr:hypothetical protein [Herpetosiphon giganteus]